MTAINWLDPVMSGGLFEKIVGCLLLNAHPGARRIIPASGDGGVDIFVPVGEIEIDVYQCKHFSGKIRWEQVEESLERLKDGTWQGRQVRRWHLVLPKQLTNKQLPTFDAKTALYRQKFECDWLGDDQLDQMAMANPAVHDYYLGNGREKLLERARDYSNVAELIAADVPLNVEMLHERLATLAASISRDDPHLRFGFGVEPTRPNHPPSQDDLVMWSVVPVGNWFVSRSVHLRYRGAEADAAGRLQFLLAIEDETARDRLTDLIRYGGLPVDLAGSDGVSVTWPDISGDLGEVSEMRVSPTVDRSTQALRVRFRLINDGSRTYTLKRTALTDGTDGSTSWWASPGGKFQMVARSVREEGWLNLRLEPVEDFDDRPIHDFAEDLDLLRSLSSAVGMSFAPMGSNQWSSPIDSEPLAAPAHLPILLTALLVIQEWTADTVTVPDGLTQGQLRQLVHDAALLAGIYFTSNTLGTAPEHRVPTDELERSDLWSVGKTLAFTYRHTKPVTSLELPHMSVELSEPFVRHEMFPSLRVADISLDPSDTTATITYEPVVYPFMMTLGLRENEPQPDNDSDSLSERLGHVTTERSLDQIYEQLALWLASR